MTLQPAGFPGMQEPQAPKAFMPGDHLGVSTHQWLPFRPGLDSRCRSFSVQKTPWVFLSRSKKCHRLWRKSLSIAANHYEM